VEITLSDCLACSGCITSAESVLITQQSQEQMIQVFQENKQLIQVRLQLNFGEIWGSHSPGYHVYSLLVSYMMWCGMVFHYHHFGRTLVLLHSSMFHYAMTLNFGDELKQWVLSLLTSIYAHRSGTVIQHLFSEDDWIKWTLFSLLYVRWGIIWFFWNVTVVDNL